MYERSDNGNRDWQILATFGTPPAQTRTGYLFPIEGQRWLATAVGYLQDYPPDDETGFLEFIRSLERPNFYETIKDLKPLSPVVTFRFPAHRHKHYEKLTAFPKGLLVLGDAVCRFNPVYGQGMSACALEVDLLDKMLSECSNSGIPAEFAQRFFKQSARIIANPWLLATSSDFLYPATGGKRPFGTRLLNWYMVHVFKLCAWNRAVLLRFYRVLHFLDKPSALFHPYVVFSVCKQALGFGGGKKLNPQAPIRE
jgi:2-polyprenyl-6-methoxyphenol hydroxylase-like FAD-dependent oxidoreductase